MTTALPSSYKDPDGFIFKSGTTYFRHINPSYKTDYELLMRSGLYEKLVSEKLLVPHQEEPLNKSKYPHAYKVIKPTQIPFISYPYEWTFSQLKDAALTTLRIQTIALEFGMTLKDASAYNIQFYQGRPILIDTLSFTEYHHNTPWIPYRQFCEHFFCPLALMSKRDVRLGQLLRINLEGIPLQLAHRLLPLTSYLSLPLLMHIHLHARSQSHAHLKTAGQKVVFPISSLRGLLDNLMQGISSLALKPSKTTWSAYYEQHSYANTAFEHKINSVAACLSTIKPKTVWDLGANQGVFSRLASNRNILTLSFDNDPLAMEQNYLEAKKTSDHSVLPLIMDITNPSPSLGFMHQERLSLIERGPADLIMALALIHHLAIGKNLPFSKIFAFFHTIARAVLVEFVPKNDPMVQQMLLNRADIFSKYTQIEFETAARKYFRVVQITRLKNSKRILYLLRRK